MGDLLRGTTPVLRFCLNPDRLTVDRIDELELVFVQNETYLYKSLNDCTLDLETNSVMYGMTEEETLGFEARKPVKFQFRFQVGEKTVGTHIGNVTFEELLSKKPFGYNAGT